MHLSVWQSVQIAHSLQNLHFYFKYYISSSLSILSMLFQNINFVIFRCISCPLDWNQLNAMSVWQSVQIAHSLQNLHSYYKHYVSSPLSILLMEFQNIWNFQVVIMPTTLKTIQCNECLSVCANCAFFAIFTFFLLILRIFAPKHPIDGIPKHLLYSSGCHAN